MQKPLLHCALLLALSLLTVPTAFAQGSWQLVWQDEFNGQIGPDWVFETGTGSNGWGNNEQQYYRRENARVENGALVITARREDFGGRRYTSARLKTQGRKSWKYGRIEARLSIPYGSGLWPAFWMLGDNISQVGWPACGEIDIMEHINADDNLFGTVHWQDGNGNYASYSGERAGNYRGYHVYAIEWDSRAIKWFVDGQLYHEIDITNGINGTDEFQKNQFILLNLAVGGQWPGYNIDEGRLPTSYLIDYVRVYQRSTTPPPSSARRIEAESYTYMNGVLTEACTEGGQNVGYIDRGDWLAYSNINFPTSGNYEFEYRVASPGGGSFTSDLNGGTVVLGQVNVPATGGWQRWTSVRQTKYINAGTYSFGLYAVQAGWNINWINIRRVDASARITPSVVEAGASVRVYPTTTDGLLNVVAPADRQALNYSILDLSGRTVRSVGALSSSQVDVSNLVAGMYLLLVHDGNRTKQHRFIRR